MGQVENPCSLFSRAKCTTYQPASFGLRAAHVGVHTKNDDSAEAIKIAPHGEDNVFRFPLLAN